MKLAHSKNFLQAERILDPSTVSALFTVILAVRNKLNALGLSHVVPKDPFLQPRQFSRALAAFVNQHLRQMSTPGLSSPQSDELGIAAPMGFTHVQHAYLNRVLLGRIDAAFAKQRSSDAYKVHRVLFSRLDDITTATTNALATATSSTTRSRAASQNVEGPSLQQVSSGATSGAALSAKDRDVQSDLFDGTPDLSSFISRVVGARGRDTYLAPSIRYLWSGRLDQYDQKRQEGRWADAEKEREEDIREREREKSDSDEDGLASVPSGGNSAFPRPWGNRMQKKIESWAERGKEIGGRVGGRGKKGSVDLGVAIKEKLNHLGGRTTPMVVISRYVKLCTGVVHSLMKGRQRGRRSFRGNE